jgi:hypothetical protein
MQETEDKKKRSRRGICTILLLPGLPVLTRRLVKSTP